MRFFRPRDPRNVFRVYGQSVVKKNDFWSVSETPVPSVVMVSVYRIHRVSMITGFFEFHSLTKTEVFPMVSKKSGIDVVIMNRMEFGG